MSTYPNIIAAKDARIVALEAQLADLAVENERLKEAPDYNPGPLEVSVVGMPEFDALIDYIYEEGTSGEAVIQLANKLVRAAIQSHISIRDLLAERDTLAAENEQLRAERVWQPIETAPKDGTKVDLWVVDPLGEGKRIPDCSWGWGQWIGSKGLAAERLGHKATHWIYRPVPPQEQ